MIFIYSFFHKCNRCTLFQMLVTCAYITLKSLFYFTQVHPLPQIESQNPQEIISSIGGLRGESASGSGRHCQSNPAFVVEMFARENPEVLTIQPGQEHENMVC